jgi:hypothetical protein
MMAIRIELWLDDAVADGTEQWWDEVDEAIDGAAVKYPLLDAIDAYGETRLQSPWLADLAKECRELQEVAPESLRPFLMRLAAFCDRGSANRTGQLRFVGD